MESQKVRKIDILVLYLNINSVLKRYQIDSCMRRNDSQMLFASLSQIIFISMANRELLSEDDIQDHLAQLPNWQRVENTIVREKVASNFVSIIGLVNSIAIYAEHLDHHPDLLIYGWNQLRITLTTHDKGGLTEKDFELAKKIEEIEM
jgi:4a-hydroxytetrahydrobiopterin dehydratase